MDQTPVGAFSKFDVMVTKNVKQRRINGKAGWLGWHGIIETSQPSVKSLYLQRTAVNRWNVLLVTGRGFVKAKLEVGKSAVGYETLMLGSG